MILTFQEHRQDTPERPLILAGLFASTTFARDLEAAAAGICTLERCDDRARLLPSAAARHPVALLLPVVDRHDRPTAPLVVTCRRRIPDVSVVLLVDRSRSRGANVVAALRAGARVASVESPEELRAVLGTVLEELELSSHERRMLTDVLLGLPVPDESRAMLLYAAVGAHRRLTVGDLARSVGVSTRNLARSIQASRSPSASELVVWGRVLRAAIVAHRRCDAPRNLIAATGYVRQASLERALKRLSPSPAGRNRLRTLSLAGAVAALEDRLVQRS